MITAGPFQGDCYFLLFRQGSDFAIQQLADAHFLGQVFNALMLICVISILNRIFVV